MLFLTRFFGVTFIDAERNLALEQNYIEAITQRSLSARPFFRFALSQTFGLGRPQQGVLAIRTWTAPLDSASSGNDRGMTATPLVGTSGES